MKRIEKGWIITAAGQYNWGGFFYRRKEAISNFLERMESFAIATNVSNTWKHWHRIGFRIVKAELFYESEAI